MFKRGIFVVVILIVAAALPAVLVSGYSIISGDTSVRPLAVSHTPARRSRTNEIVVQVEWGRDASYRITEEEFGQRLVDAFYAHGEAAIIEISPVSGSDVMVTFHSGPNTFGPMTAREAASGIRPVIAAFRMSSR